MFENKQHRWSAAGRRAFTLMEYLVAVIIIGIFMAVAMPLFLSAMGDAQVKQCRVNLQSIAQAEVQYKMKNANHVYTTDFISLKSINPTLGACPLGGSYTMLISDGTATGHSSKTVPAGGLVISCSISSHDKYAPSVDDN